MDQQKHFFMVAIIGLAALSGSAQPGAVPILPLNEEICGFTRNYFRYNAEQVRQGLAVELLVGDAQANHPVTLRFLVNLKPRSLPVDDLQVEHEKFMHVLGVRDDLREFIHLHPRKAGPGLWAVSHTFTNRGSYKLWTEVKYRGGSYVFGHSRLRVAAPATNPTPDADPAKGDRDSGYQLSFTSSEPLRVGRTNQLEFTLRAADGAEALTANFLGAPMHLVIVKDDLSVMLHAHPENHRPGQPVIRFHQVFPRPGTYKLFAQYRPQDLKLPLDDALLAEFVVRVAGDQSATIGRAAP
jgi:hypothetical protein